jgi:ribosomal protein L31
MRKPIHFKTGVLPSKFYCSECGDEFYTGSTMYYYADENPYKDEHAFVFCSKDCIRSNAYDAELQLVEASGKVA